MPAPEALDAKAIEIIKARTIERDFQFIEQSDGVVVVYMTDKLSPGVIAEMQLAHRSQKPVFLAFPGARSPFLEDIATVIEPDMESLLPHLRKWANEGPAAA
jgi:nucleoside 2-deoxyribosyltransferase